MRDGFLSPVPHGDTADLRGGTDSSLFSASSAVP